MENTNKWIKEYIKNIDLKKIKWIKLNPEELNMFFNENYWDKDVCEYVCNKDDVNIYPTLLGMHFLNLNDSINDKTYRYSFLLGIVDNNIGKKTIVCATIYLYEYFMFTNQEKPVTYISTMEVNSYFREMGIYKKMCETLINFISPNQHVIITKQTEMGEKCHVFEILKEKLLKNSFKNYVFEDDNPLTDSKLRDIVCSKSKILKK